MGYSQKDKQKRGSDFEAEFRASISQAGFWCYKIITGFSGTPFDYLLMKKDGRALAVELKRTAKNTLSYSQIRDKQRKGLTDFHDRGGKAYIVWNVKNENENRCYIIPWVMVMNEINSGVKGSIKVDKFEEAPRLKLDSGKYGWNFNNFLSLGEVIY